MATEAAGSQQPTQPNNTYRLATIAEGLSHPWCLAFLPDGDLLVTERSGALRLIRGGTLQSQPIDGVPPVYVRGEGGLFDVAPHPDFGANRLLYLSYVHGDAGGNATRVARARLDGLRLVELTPIFTVWSSKRQPRNYGGRMAFLPDGTLLLTIGDRYDHRQDAQRLDSPLGKVVRLNDNGSIPDDNPFVSDEARRAEIWTYGHRNPQGLALAPSVAGEPPTVYLHEHGPRGGDELNRLEPGANYGWPLATDGTEYNGAPISPFREYAGTEQPLLHWTPSIAPAGMAWYGGDLFPHWRGDLFVASLSRKAIVRIDLENGRVVRQEWLFKEIGERLRDVRVGPNGHLYVLTDSRRGRIVRVDPVR